MRTQRDLESAIAQLKRSKADLTDDHIAIFRDRKGDEFADRVEQARARHRLGEAYQQKIADEQRAANYDADVRRRRQLDSLNQREACWKGTEPPSVRPPGKRGVVRILSAEEIQRRRDLARGIVRIDPRFRR